jgi:hypothetical protein
MLDLYGFFIPVPDLSSLSLHPNKYASLIIFDRRRSMDIVFIAAAAGLWGVMVLMVWGFRKLEKPAGGRP